MQTPKHHQLIYVSSPDRGLEILLKLWPRIIEKFPDAKLHVYYGFVLFDKMFRDNPERMAWKDKIMRLLKQKGVYYYGRVGQDKLARAEQKCGVWVYPTFFQEINCISALSCQSHGLVPVTMNAYALKETVGSGTKVDGDIYDKKTQEEWLRALFAYIGNKKRWIEESKKAKEFAKEFSWDNIANEWLKVIEEK